MSNHMASPKILSDVNALAPLLWPQSAVGKRARERPSADVCLEPAIDWPQRAQDAWNEPGWCQAAAEYHRARGHRTLIVETEPERLGQLRRLLDDNVSLERAWSELSQRNRDRAAPASVEALVCELRTHGLTALQRPNCRRRLDDVSTAQLREVLSRPIKLRPKYPSITVDLLLKLGGLL